MNKEQREMIINRAIEKGDFFKKSMTAMDASSCLANANKNYGSCVINGKWHRIAYATCTGILFVAAIACAVAILYTSAGTASYSVGLLISGIITSICVLCAKAFNAFVSDTVKADCLSSQITEINNCQLIYGTSASGGAE